MTGGRISGFAMLMAGAVLVGAASPASAQERETYQFDLPAQDLGEALRAVAAKAGWELYASADDLNGVAAPSLHGTFSAREAVERLVRGTNLAVRFDKGAVIVRGRSEVAAGNSSSEKDVIVTGSRIRGAEPAAPTMAVTSNDMRRAGQIDLGEAMRSLPFNFGGGQNPGIGATQGAANENVNGASSVNLYGLGPNATLTLLNGMRLSYTGVNAAVDISSIPAAAVDRVEVLADGASAIYGSDAVAGVVNVILRRNYNGASIDARVGGATDGGYFQQQYNLIGGRTWRGGGALAVYDYSSNSDIRAGERSYTASMAADSTIYPRLWRHNGLVSLYQNVGEALTGSVDVLFNDRQQAYVQSFTNQPYINAGATAAAHTRSFLVSPSVVARLGDDWTIRLISSYGTDRTEINSNIYFGGTFYGTSYRRYNNESLSLEASAEGAVVQLPAGAIRVAIGGGYRRNGIDLVSTTLGVTSRVFDQHRVNRFGYAEVYIPLISPAQESVIGRSLSFTGAFRYESNSGVSSVGLPKAGIIFEPFDGVTLKASWGRSFRLPTLFQQYSSYSAVLLPTAGYATGYPTGSTFIALQGAGPDMKPERSENWTLSAEVRPTVIPGLTGSISYFRFNYRDRIATPIVSSVGALNNPIYASLITSNPSLALQQAIAAGADIGLQNGTGKPYDPGTVVALLDGRDRNVARETYRGVNLSVRYAVGSLDHQRVDFSLDGTWLNSSRQLLQGLAAADLAGTLFNPPQFRARIGVTYSTQVFSISGYANHASRLTDNRTLSIYSIRGPSTFDMATVVKAGSGIEFSANINNIFNAKPPIIVTGAPSDTPFDTTNFSQIGRFISVSVRKSW
ncbi:TonB-dependent siderophore receptor [Sphingomonas sp. CL5.1]|uniref:TonB-dependent receptor plug domain-containing protein n=1 Tax=Sphingomonas sp. CL5.1 TaxID=2653203 RepID=UPI0020C65C4B|nr:TonB-dependent receptor [Sphingomonas sp. CL5.1]